MLSLAAVLLATSFFSSRPVPDVVDPGPEPTATTYAPSSNDIANPERGLYSSIDLVKEKELDWFRDQGHVMAHAYVRLGAFPDRQ
jgi:hypothetical protein